MGDSGTLAVRLKMESDLLLTQRLVLQPEVELNAYSRPDLSRAKGAGLSDLSTGLRLRYRVRREVAPYVGIAWTGRFGATARLLRDRDIVPDALQWTAGIRVLF
jgi:copper resistance protein B